MGKRYARVSQYEEKLALHKKHQSQLKKFKMEERKHQAKQNGDMLNMMKVQNIYYLYYNFNQNFIKTTFYNLCAIMQ